LQQKPTKKIYEEINKAKKEIGLYSNNPWAKYISELNVYNNTMDFRLNDNEFIIYIHNEEQKSILCKNKNIYEVSMEYIKENYPDRLSMLDESEKKDKPPKF
jgi:hypothetical protein